MAMATQDLWHTICTIFRVTVYLWLQNGHKSVM